MSEEANEYYEEDPFVKWMDAQDEKRIIKHTFILNEEDLTSFYEVVTKGALSSKSAIVARKLSTPDYTVDEVPPGQVFEDHFILVLEESVVVRFINWASIFPPTGTRGHPFPDLPIIIRNGLTRGAIIRS